MYDADDEGFDIEQNAKPFAGVSFRFVASRFHPKSQAWARQLRRPSPVWDGMHIWGYVPTGYASTPEQCTGSLPEIAHVALLHTRNVCIVSFIREYCARLSSDIGAVAAVALRLRCRAPRRIEERNSIADEIIKLNNMRCKMEMECQGQCDGRDYVQ